MRIAPSLPDVESTAPHWHGPATLYAARWRQRALAAEGVDIALARLESVRAQESFAIANGLAGLVVIAVVALAANSTARAIERHLLAWHYARTLGGQIGRPL